MRERWLAKLAAWSLKKKVAAALVTVLIASGAAAYGVSQLQSDPASSQEQQTEGQQPTDAVLETEGQEATSAEVPDDESSSEHSEESLEESSTEASEESQEDIAEKAEKPEESTEVLEGDDAPQPVVHMRTVHFVTNGGSSLEDRRVVLGSKISEFPTPYREGYIFLGWFFDEELTRAVSSRDTVTEDMTLYASYLQEAPLDTLTQVTFASAENVGPDFAIRVVTEDLSMDAQSVLDAITADNLTDPGQEGFIVVNGAAGAFTITGQTLSEVVETVPGFEAGSTFRITLNDTRLRFENQPESVREFNFTTDQEEVLNLALKGGIIYIAVDELSNITNNGEEVSTLDIALYEADENGTLGAADMTVGTFEYLGELQIGDIVSVYEGLIPTQRTLDTPDDQLGDLAYIEITGRNGNRYSYKNAQPEDVIFEPDMLPVPVDADQDTSNTTITVNNNYFDYSADVYANIELDSQTTVDVGDFLMFYTGTFGEETGENAAQLLDVYGRITGVTVNADGTTTVEYTEVDWAEVQAVMDVYTQDQMTGTELLEGVDIEGMEAEIEQQAIDSGFAEEAAQYLASLALATENFTKLSENMNLEDYKVTLVDGTPVSPEQLQLMDSGISAEVELEKGYPKATVSTKPKNLGSIEGTDADKQGLAIKLEVKATITIGKNGSDNQLVITVSGAFTEEVGVDFGAKSKTIWETWGIFPYIAEYRVTANVDLINYTGVEFNATMVTKEKEDEDSEDDESKDIAEEIKELLKQNADGEEEEGSGNKLVERYSEMLKAESDWIKVVDKNIVEKEQRLPPALPIIAVKFSLDFVVQMDASISVGFDFEYIEGKRYTFTVNVFAGEVSSDVISLEEQAYEFSFYAMGRLGVKVGLEMEFAVGLFSTEIASVGFEAGVGPYAKLWGYFFYELRYTESTGRSQKYSGALLLEVGAYLEVALKAEAIGGKYSAEHELVDKEWALWQVGRSDNVLDFTTEQENMPEILLKQHVRAATIPDSTFLMHYLDLKSGEEKDAVYNDYFDPNKKVSVDNRKNYEIIMTNEKFSYDPQTNTIKVSPAEGDKKLEGEMIITWINAPMSFSSKPIQRTISLYWDNLRDGYVIVPYTNGGSYIQIINKKFEAPITVPEDPVKQGYIFEGWYSDEELTVPYIFPATMPAEDANIYAKWSAAADTVYTVEHYQEQLASGEYELIETEVFTGTTDSYAEPEVKDYVGYIAPAKTEVKILPDGSAVLRYYYALQRHTITFEPGEIGGEAVSFELKYGGRSAAPQMAAKGYTFVGWTEDGTGIVTPVSNMGTEDLTYTALWIRDPDTSYRIEYYVQQIDGRYTLQHMIEDVTYTGTILVEADLRAKSVDQDLTADQKYILEDGVVFENMTVKGVECDSAVVEGNGKTVIKINYKRLQHNLTFDFGHEGAEPVSKDLYYGEAVSVPQNVTCTGYTFAGWSVDGSTVVTPETIMGTQTVAYTALWTPNQYKVSFQKGNDLAEGTMSDMSFIYDEEQNLMANEFAYTHYTFAGWATQPGGRAEYSEGECVKNLTAKHQDVLTLYATWVPIQYNIIYNGTEKATNTNPGTYHVEKETIVLTAPVRAGYTFDGWYDNAEFTGSPVVQIVKGSSGEKVLFAKWIANTDTAYQVEHYKQNIDGSYILADTDDLTGTSDSSVTPEVKSYMGFEAPSTQTVNVSADGATVVRYEYARQSYTITFDPNGGTLGADASDTLTALYEEEIALPTPIRDGYGFGGWYKDSSFDGDAVFNSNTMPAENLTLIAKWTEGEYGYTVNHYQQNVNGEGYTLAQSEVETGLMDHEITPDRKSYEGFIAPEEAQTIIIGTDISQNVVNYYYIRNQYTLSWDLAGGDAEEQNYTTGNVYYGAAVTVPDPVRTGYSYAWDSVPVIKMPAQDLAYKAIWTANGYQVTFDVDGGTVVTGSVDTRAVTFDAAYGELAVLEKYGHTFEGWYSASTGGSRITAETNVSTAANHTLYAQYTPINYSITYHNMEGAVHTNPVSYHIEAGGITLAAPKKTGYTFNGWYVDEAFTELAGTIVAGSTGERVFYAKWTENNYTVIFHSNNGGDQTTSQNFTYTETKALERKPEEYVKANYIFSGWAMDSADKTAKYTDGQTVEKLSAMANDEVHLYAVWTPIQYAIVYKNMDGAVNASDNPVSFTVEDNMFTLHDPEKVGYTFEGWFMDEELTDQVDDVIILNSPQTWTFYAKWAANPYTITFDSCLGVTVPTETMLMEYDKSANLTLLSEITRFDKPGYTFRGWSTEAGGSVAYTDGQNVKNLATEGNVYLYAVWELNVFNITYNLGTGASANNTANPITYSIESGDVQILTPVAKSGYQFLGWYEGDTLVTEIVKGTQKDYTLTAKWAHGGTFTIAYTSKTSVTGGYNLTFTVTRTLPVGTVATDNPQYVYYRTVNGTAYGNTVDAGGDKYHFKHVGGENVYLIFDSSCGNGSTKTFTVNEKDAYNADDISASFQIGNTSRYYNVELYKVVDTVGGCQGSLGSTKSVKRTIAASSEYKLTTSFYQWYSKNLVGSTAVKVTDAGFADNTRYTVSPKTIFNDNNSTSYEKYRDKVSSYYGFYISYELKESDDGYQRANFNYGTSYDADNLLADYRFATKDGEVASSWGRTMTLPNYGKSAQGDILFNVGDCYVTENWSMVSGTVSYAKVSKTNSINFGFNASGSKDDDWYYRNLNVYVKVHDQSKPSQVGIAPLALTKYKAGDQISITVIYNEVINSVSGVSLSSISELPIKNATYVGGEYTNALTFTATVTKDFEVTPDLNNTLVNIKPVSGTVRDILGN